MIFDIPKNQNHTSLKVHVGVDIVDTKRFLNFDFINSSFLKKIFTQNEVNYCLSKSNPHLHFAARFAGKEAVLKLFGNLGENIKINEIEIINKNNGSPMVVINNTNYCNIEISISLSHSQDIAVAFASCLL